MKKRLQFLISCLQPEHHYPEANSTHFTSPIFYDVHALIAVFSDCMAQAQLTNVFMLSHAPMGNNSNVAINTLHFRR